jgi:transmembrane sensor
MSNSDHSDQADPVLDEALDWIIRLKVGQPTSVDVAAFQLWRAQSPSHEEALKDAARIWRHACVAADELVKEQAGEAGHLALFSLRRPRTRRLVLGTGIAAAAAAAFTVVDPPFGLWPSLRELSADYRTTKGERRKFDVAADVSMELNTQTSVTLRTMPQDTEIELISGEARVSAKRPLSRPLVTLAAGGRISAGRAEFNARCLDGVVSVTCMEGFVDIEQDGQTLRLDKANQLTYSSEGMTSPKAAEIEEIAAWQSGSLIFNHWLLGDVVAEVNRYRSGKIIITNPEMKLRIVNGTFQIDKLGNFIAQVRQLFGARVTSLPGGIVLIG